jgi:hypothetical protein
MTKLMLEPHNSGDYVAEQSNLKANMAKKPKLTPVEIEAKYDSGDTRLSQERNDFLLPQIIDFVRNKNWMNIRPEYQRRLVWNNKKKSLFIESLLMNIPVPPIFLYESDLSRYEVMDGQQRLNTILEFYENNLTLTGLNKWSELNGYTYSKCPPRIQKGLDRRRLSATVLLAETRGQEGNATRREVFERLNTGGQTLNAQELRNSLYSGSFNDLILELAGLRLFDEIWSIPAYDDHYDKSNGFISPELANNKLFKRMTDCQIVLRFFAFRRTAEIRGSARKILDRCMADLCEADPAEIDEMRSSFTECLSMAHEIFGEYTFKVLTRLKKWRHSVALFDAVMVSLESLRDHKGALVAARAEILSDLEKEFNTPTSYVLIVGKLDTADAIKGRTKIIGDLLKKYI